MVTIITAMASKAPFTFLDEPVAGLDVIAREQFYQLLLDEYTETGRTFVVSTHIIEEASDIFEEVIIVDKGEILLKENTQELLNRAYHISGHEDLVKAARQQAQIYHEEHIKKHGRNRTSAAWTGTGNITGTSRAETESSETLCSTLRGGVSLNEEYRKIERYQER